MRTSEDKELRNFEIRQWFYLLQKQYQREGLSFIEASEQAYDDIGMRFCLRKTSIRKAKNAGSRSPKDRSRLMLEVRENIQHLKQVIKKLEKVLNERQGNLTGE